MKAGPFLSITAAALVLVSACGGGASGPAPDSNPAALVPAQPGQLVAYMADRLRARFGTGLPAGLSAATGGAAASVDALEPRTAIGTLVQEADVDEADLLKLQGDAVLSLHDGRLRRHRLEADVLTPRDELTLHVDADDLYLDTRGLYLQEDGQRAVVLTQRWQVGGWSGGCPAVACASIGLIAYVPTLPQVLVQPVALAGDLAAAPTLTIDGHLVGSRRIGRHLVLVTVHVPALAVDALPPDANTADREAVLAALTADDLLPKLRVGTQAATPLVSEADCLLQPGNGSQAVEITTVTVFDLATPDLARRSLCFAGGTEAMSMSTDSLVLATTRSPYVSGGTGTQIVYPTQMSTDVHRFALVDGAASYRASGSVDGHLGWDDTRKSQRFSAWNGDLRVLSFTGSEGWGATPAAGLSPSPATLTVLREDGAHLRPVGRLPNAQRTDPLGKPGEQVYAVRFVGDRAYVVTFLQVDPLYVIDLSDPADPYVAGVLEVPGFSQDLFTVGDGWLLGIGRSADADGRITGLAVSLLDVRDASAPRQQSVQFLGGPGSSTALDFSSHGLNLLRDGSATRAALPVTLPVGGTMAAVLQRIEVDTTLGTLALKAPVVDGDGPTWPDVSRDRTLVLGPQVIHLSTTGALRLHDW
jgi:hypothetical protein